MSSSSQFAFEIRKTLPAPGCYTKRSDVVSEKGFPIVKAKTDVNTVIVSGTGFDSVVWMFTGLDSAGP